MILCSKCCMEIQTKSLLHWSLHIGTWLGKTAACRNLGVPYVKATCWWKFLIERSGGLFTWISVQFCQSSSTQWLDKKYQNNNFNSLPGQNPSADDCGPCLGMCGSRCWGGSWGKFAHTCQFFVAHAGHLIAFLGLWKLCEGTKINVFFQLLNKLVWKMVPWEGASAAQRALWIVRFSLLAGA